MTVFRPRKKGTQQWQTAMNTQSVCHVLSILEINGTFSRKEKHEIPAIFSLCCYTSCKWASNYSSKIWVKHGWHLWQFIWWGSGINQGHLKKKKSWTKPNVQLEYAAIQTLTGNLHWILYTSYPKHQEHWKMQTNPVFKIVFKQTSSMCVNLRTKLLPCFFYFLFVQCELKIRRDAL